MSHIHEQSIEAKDRALFDRIAEKYARKDRVTSSSLPRKYQLLFAVEPALQAIGELGNIMEVACGLGASSEYLRGKYSRYIGIDYSARFIAKAREFYAENKKAEFLSLNVKDLAACFPAQYADLILAVGALHHMTELDKVMECLKYIAKPRSYFVAIEPNRTNPLIQCLRFVWARINSSYSSDQKYFAKDELKSLMLRHNMEDLELEFQGFFTPPFAQVVLYPQIISIPLSRFAILLDKFLDTFLPEMLKFLSWNIVVRARFPTSSNQ